MAVGDRVMIDGVEHEVVEVRQEDDGPTLTFAVPVESSGEGEE